MAGRRSQNARWRVPLSRLHPNHFPGHRPPLLHGLQDFRATDVGRQRDVARHRRNASLAELSYSCRHQSRQSGPPASTHVPDARLSRSLRCDTPLVQHARHHRGPRCRHLPAQSPPHRDRRCPMWSRGLLYPKRGIHGILSFRHLSILGAPQHLDDIPLAAPTKKRCSLYPRPSPFSSFAVISFGVRVLRGLSTALSSSTPAITAVLPAEAPGAVT